MNSQLIFLPKIVDPRGNLTFIESLSHIPFRIQRSFWIYDVPGGETRGGHAYKNSEEFIVALSGSFDVGLDDGEKKTKYSLNRSYSGLYIPAGTWRYMDNFSTNSLALVLASTYFSEADYIRDYSEFISFKRTTTQFELTENKLKKLNSINVNSKKSLISDCSPINLDVNHKIKGNITVIENQKTLPLSFDRVYYIYDIPGGETRGAHAHKNLYQLIIAASGSFDIILKDGRNQKTIHLNRSYLGVVVVPGIWEELTNFSSGSICLVLASDLFDETDYIKDFNKFLSFKKT
jgi:oxalate decarboxylase/phosphoglucose isomerase-like protein (cupin superfamily)